MVSLAGSGAPSLLHAKGERALARHDDVVRGARVFADGDLELGRPRATDAFGADVVVAGRQEHLVALRRRARQRDGPVAIVEEDARAGERFAGRLLEDAPR